MWNYIKHTGRRLTRRIRRLAEAPEDYSHLPRFDVGVVGAAGWIARVHLDALRRTGQNVVVAMDPSDAGIAILDDKFPDARFVRDEEALEEFLSRPDAPELRWLGICSPDFAHRRHMELALRCGVDAVCEKPLVMDPKDLDDLEELEKQTGRRIYPIMQHRYNPAVLAEAARAGSGRPGLPGRSERAQVDVTYVAHRGPWYLSSWRGREDQAAGLAMDIGIHFFDLLIELFGDLEQCRVQVRTPTALGGTLTLDGADVRWFLSIDRRHMPTEMAALGIRNLRSFQIDGREVELSQSMGGLHATSYAEIAAGRGLRIADVRPGLEAAWTAQHQPLSDEMDPVHPLTLQLRRRLDEGLVDDHD